MFFLIRACFWIGVVWLLMPASMINGTAQGARGAGAIGLATDAAGTAVNLCRQRPSACQAVIRALAGNKTAPPAESTAQADVAPPRPATKPTKRKAG